MAIELSRLQSVHGSGGPFGALVCDDATGEVIGVGVNLVESTGLSSAHAEWVAWSMAQSHMGQGAFVKAKQRFYVVFGGTIHQPGNPRPMKPNDGIIGRYEHGLR